MPRAGGPGRAALDDAGHLEHTVQVNVDTDVKDFKQLYQAIVKSTGQMLGEISQQIVEFDTERKQADSDSARRLLASTELIAKRLGTVEREVLDGQQHAAVMQQLATLSQLTKEPNHDAVLKAIGNVRLEPTDISPILSEVSGFSKKHGKLESLLQTMQDSHSDLHGKHGDLSKTQKQLQDLLLAMQESHTGLHNKHSKLLGSTGKLEEMLASLHDGHRELHSRQAELLGSHGGLHDTLCKLQDSHLGLHDKHHELLGAINGISMPDLGPFHEHFATVGDAMNSHKARVSSIEQRLGNLEKAEQEQRYLLESILHRLPQDLDKQIKNLQAEVRNTQTMLQRDCAVISESVQTGDRSLLKELQQFRLDTSSTLASVEKDIRKSQQAVADSAKQIASASREQSAELLQGLKGLEDALELEAIISGVTEKLKKVNLRTDFTPILAALECVPELHQRVCHMHDQVSSSNVHYDPSDVLKAISKIKQAPDHDTIAAAVHDRIAKANIKVDTTDLHRALGKIDLDKAFEAHLNVIDGKLRKHSSDVLKAIGSMPDHNSLVDSLHTRLASTTMNVDLGELKQMIRRIPTEHDHDALASAVHDRIGSAISSAGNHSKILSAIGNLNLSPDLTVVLEAIEAMEESVVTTILEAIQGIDMQVMCRGVLPASVAPQVRNGAAKVRQTYGSRQRQLAAPPVEPSGSTDAEDQQLQPRSLRETSFWAGGKTRSTGAAAAADTKLASQFDAEVSVSETPILACTCGFTCGTAVALERHVSRLAGQKGHRPV